MTAQSEETPETVGGERASPYADAVEEYLEAASWLTAADAPLKVHARSIAKSLDKQLAERDEIQSALASSFDKVLMRLDARRPPATRPPTDPLAPSDDGTPSMLGFLDG